MNEVRHVWTSLRSSSKSSTLNSLNMNNENNRVSTTTWYDIPAPIIIHCRDFRENEVVMINEKMEDQKCQEDNERPTSVSSIVSNDKIHVEEALYENNMDMVIHENSKDIKDESRLLKIISNDLKTTVETSLEDKNKVHSSSVELMATTFVKTDEHGMPTISFSFLQGDELLERNTQEIDEISLEDKNDNIEESILDRLYDFPKKSSNIDNDNETLTKENERKIEENSDNAIAELYDKPKRLSSKTLIDVAKKSDNDVTDKEIIIIERKFTRTANRSHGSSVRSLKLRKHQKTSESDTGITSTSGCYSDPECSNDTASNVSHSRIRSEKRKLGKAWGKMRNWLRDEKSKLSEVIQRHARMQNVGAMITDLNDDHDLSFKDTKLSKGKRYASYDLTKARTQELGSITRVEEFGLSTITKETNEEHDNNSSNVNRRSNSGSPNSDNRIFIDDINPEDKMFANRRTAFCKTASSDDILGNEKRNSLLPVSFSMDKLCSDTENDETCVASAELETTRDRAGKGGMIKRRMLGSIRGLMASTHLLQTTNDIHEEGGQSGFEDIRRYVKQGGDFCKELASILHERAELEATYAKGLSKLSSKLTKACSKDQSGNSNGGVNEAWRCVGEEMEAAAEAHRVWGIALGEQLAKPLRVGVAEAQGRSRKSIENSVDKALKSLQEWRNIASKTKKQSFACARENERLQDLARLQSISQSQQNNNKSSNHHMTEKEANKLEARRRKAEDSSRRADTEFYTVSVRAERARLEYESTVKKGSKQMELLEEERLSALKDLANVYLAHLQALAPRLQQSADRLSTPIRNCNVSQDVEILKNLIRRTESNDTVNAEQLLPDFYAEHITLAMNRERRKQSLVRILHLIRQDLERERRGREGLETLHRAFIKTPAFAADESTQNVTDKLHHMRSMLLYLEAARYKVGGTLAEVEGSKRNKHPLAEHILVSRDKQGLQQSVLKIPSWARNESFEIQDIDDEIDVHLVKGHETENRDWADRTAGDGNSENPPDEEDFSDFDEFSSHSEDNNNQDVDVTVVTPKSDSTEQCRAIYHYAANLNDELSLNPGDLITVHQKQADGWWIGECKGRTGIFPATYVQVIH
ncbi:uncharacterized protein LOC118449177 [Vespa mandarinia]|uniref:uncharacterized protein LOC118449177 n=1 Tax=Vespa mandarinia TaxID=7446 RepID=UPI00160B3A92|nr:uncharacterized protein LOC118449177 [Vespa mandarinia]XP_035739333.1 uncharacterized protein LOC118449177 [Vespa mandarinia]XP_035739334.1 uncharacterized protein LOC118449177 [Vespa mandarinia]